MRLVPVEPAEETILAGPQAIMQAIHSTNMELGRWWLNNPLSVLKAVCEAWLVERALHQEQENGRTFLAEKLEREKGQEQ